MYIEKRLNIKLPKEYIDFINNINKFNNKKIILLDDEEDILIKKFFTLDNKIEENVFQIYNEYRNIMLEGVIPIAETEYKDYICLYYDIDREKSPKIIFWCYELALEKLGEGMFSISNSFNEFEKKLKIE